MDTYTKKMPAAKHYDVIVVGSGSAGSVAAIAAARSGAKTLLLERLPFLGGTSTAVLDTFYGFYTPGAESKKVVAGISDDVMERLRRHASWLERPNTHGAGTGVTYHPEYLKVVWEDLTREAGAEVLLNAWVQDVAAVDKRIAKLVVATKLGLRAFTANVFVDASGDADLCHFGGFEYELAGDVDPAQTLTTTFKLCNVDVDRRKSISKDEFHRLMAVAAESGEYDLPRKEGSDHITPVDHMTATIMTRLPSYYRDEETVVNATDPELLSSAEMEGRKQAVEYIRFLRDRVPGYEKAQLSTFGMQIGVRETRRVYGEHRLTKEEVLSAKQFDDQIGLCGAPIEDHHGGADTKWAYLPDGECVGMPWGTLVPRGSQKRTGCRTLFLGDSRRARERTIDGPVHVDGTCRRCRGGDDGGTERRAARDRGRHASRKTAHPRRDIGDSMSDHYYIGIDWGGTRIKLGAVAEDATFLAQDVLDTPHGVAVDQVVDDLIERTALLIESQARQPLGIGLGLTGPVDPNLGVVLLPGKIRGLEKYPIVPRFRERFGLPVRAQNDGALSMYAEKYAGQAKDVSWAVTVTLGTGVGSGVMLDGRVLEDPNFMFGSQLGHLVINAAHDQLCLTGARGTGEMLCSATALALAVRSGLQRGIPSTLTDRYLQDPQTVDFRAVVEQGVAQGDKLCLDEMNRWARNLGWLLVNAVHAYSPEIIILSGGATLAAEYFLDDVQRHVDQHIFRYPPGRGVPIAVSNIAEHAGVLGAAMMMKSYAGASP